MSKLLQAIFIFPIKVYQTILSPLLPDSCRYEPSCSTYMVQSIKEWGVLKGIWLGTKRIVRCNPWGGCGEDPVPQNPNK